MLSSRIAANTTVESSRNVVALSRSQCVEIECHLATCSRCRTERDAIAALLRKKWAREEEYRLVKDLWAFTANRIAVRFQYECRTSGQWYRCYGNEQWEFADNGLMRRREASVNDVHIGQTERRFRWDSPGPRPADHPGLTERS